MKFGFLLPNRGRSYGEVNLLLDLAPLAEESGWDGVVPIGGGIEPCQPEQIWEIIGYIDKYRLSEAPFEVCMLAVTHG